VKQPQHITFSGLKTTPTHVASWAFELTQLHCRLTLALLARNRVVGRFCTCKAC
jgi:hypothetical protein